MTFEHDRHIQEQAKKPRVYPSVNSKRDFVRRYSLGEFGNRAPTWDTFDEYLKSGYRGLVHYRNRVASGPTWYNVEYETKLTAWAVALIDVPESDLYISAMAPTSKTLFQGELQQGVYGYELFCTTVAKPMREALREQSRMVYGTLARLTVSYYLCPSSYDWMMTLLDRYPGHVVEFSTYSTPWGTWAPGYNTVFWEIRNY